MNTSNPYDGDRIPGSVGFPLPGVEISHRRPRDRRVLPQGEVGMHRGPRSQRVQGLLADARKDQGGVPRRTVSSSTGDLGRIDERGYVAHRRARQGPDHLRRLQRLSGGGRGSHRSLAGRCRMRGDRRAARRFRRSRGRRRHSQGGSGARARRRYRQLSPTSWPSSSCRRRSSSRPNCRAMPWARCRRKISALNTPKPSPRSCRSDRPHWHHSK